MNNQVEVSNLEYLARKYSTKLIPQEEIEKQNITKEFYEDFNYAIEHKRLINIQISGTVIKGKSTVMATLVEHANKKLQKKMTIEKICTDQIEFSRKTNKIENNTCYGIDEWNTLSTGGLNASTEQQYLDWFSDVCAQRFIHRIACAPRKIIDQNSDIILEILERNNKEKYTRCLVYYKIQGINNITQLVGHADINVAKTIKQKWYEQYRRKKFKKMELINQHGSRDERDREFAELVLAIYKKLEPISEQTIVGVDIISGHIEVERDNRQLSIYTGLDLEKKIHGILRIRTQISRTKKTIQQIIKNIPKTKNIEDKKELIKTLYNYQRMNEQNRTILNEIIQKWRKKIELNKQLQKIDEEMITE